MTSASIVFSALVSDMLLVVVDRCGDRMTSIFVRFIVITFSWKVWMALFRNTVVKTIASSGTVQFSVAVLGKGSSFSLVKSAFTVTELMTL